LCNYQLTKKEQSTYSDYNRFHYEIRNLVKLLNERNFFVNKPELSSELKLVNDGLINISHSGVFRVNKKVTKKYHEKHFAS